ncbi:MAG: choice-of-anchor B family protein [Gemmatimonadota bacterium]
MKKVLTFALAVLVAAWTAAPAAAQTYRSGFSADQAMTGFASSVALGGGQLFVGESGNQTTSGIVYVYDKGEDGVWTETAQLTATDGQDADQLGAAVSAGDGRVLATARATADGLGAAYVFERDASGVWRQAARLVGDDVAEGDSYGIAAALSGDRAIVGAFTQNDTTGAAYVFRRTSEGAWIQEAKLVGSEAKGRFGVTLALDGDYAMVAATREDEAKGAVHVFQRGDEGWTETASLVATGIDKGNRFGSSIIMHGEEAFIGSPRFDNFIGAVFAYSRDEEGTYQQQARLNPFDAPTGQTRFGTSIGYNGSEIWVGAIGVSGFEGAVYRMHRAEDGSISGAVKLAQSDGSGADLFAANLALGDDVALVSVPRDDYGEGTAVVYAKGDDGHWSEAGKIFSQSAAGMETVAGGQIDCTEGEAGMFPCQEVDMVSFMPVQELGGGRGVRTNDIWGWTDEETGKEYALVGRVDGTSFVDVSDPYNPRFVGNLSKTEGSPGSTWRDIKVYEDHAFIVADGAGQHGVQIFDLEQLRDVTEPMDFEATAMYDDIGSAHNIVINEESGYAYAVGTNSGGETCGGGLHMINIQDPLQPTFAGCFADAATGRSKTGYSHDAQCVMYQGPDADYVGREICLGSNETALSIADVTDKGSPVAVSMATYPNVGYSHQGWLTEDHRYFYMNDELDELQGKVEGTRTLVWDLADLDDPILVKEHMSDNPSIDHNLYIKGNLMYQSNYVSGLRVLDISNPEEPVQVGYFDTVPFGDDSPRFDGSWSNYPFFESGIIIVTSGQEGLFVLKKKDARLVP